MIQGYCHNCGGHGDLESGSNWCSSCMDHFYGRNQPDPRNTMAANASSRLKSVQESLRGRPVAYSR